MTRSDRSTEKIHQFWQSLHSKQYQTKVIRALNDSNVTFKVVVSLSTPKLLQICCIKKLGLYGCYKDLPVEKVKMSTKKKKSEF